jgi:hypothetical protein
VPNVATATDSSKLFDTAVNDRVVESFRQDGNPRICVLVHLGRAEDILRLMQDRKTELLVTAASPNFSREPSSSPRSTRVGEFRR